MPNSSCVYKSTLQLLLLFLFCSFAVGSDGVVYEGRGWEAVGAHASGHNAKSIGIALIGDWRGKFQSLPLFWELSLALG